MLSADQGIVQLRSSLTHLVHDSLAKLAVNSIQNTALFSLVFRGCRLFLRVLRDLPKISLSPPSLHKLKSRFVSRLRVK